MRTNIFLVFILLTIAVVIGGHTAVPASTESVNDSPDSHEIAARFMIEGAKSFTLRGWRIDFIDAFEMSGDCGLGSYVARATKDTQFRYWKTSISNCGSELNVSVKWISKYKSTEIDPISYESRGEPVVTEQTKPAFGLNEIESKGAFIKTPSGSMWGTIGTDGTHKSSVEVKLADGSDSWQFMAWQDKQGVIHLEPSGMTRSTYTYK